MHETAGGIGRNTPLRFPGHRSVYSEEWENGYPLLGQFPHPCAEEKRLSEDPLLYQNLALEDVRVDGAPAIVVSEEGTHRIVLSKPGEHIAEAVFSVKSAAAQGPQRLDLMVLPTPILLLRLELPVRGIDVDVPRLRPCPRNRGARARW